MNSFQIKLASVTDVQDFVRAASVQHFKVEALSGGDRIDAKSIMGLFTLDLREPIQIEVDGEEPEVRRFCASISHVMLPS